MKISDITLHNFRVYRGSNTLELKSSQERNLTIIAGKNGYGKTTFLTALIWVFYGRLMAQVEDKYKRDIKNAGGYENYLLDTFNKSAKQAYEENVEKDSLLSVEVNLTNLLIPSIPCKTVKIKRSYDLRTNDETLLLLIDGDESELTKEVGYEVFINDFILPREIAKFFFFDAEKIVSLAEAKSKQELRNLSRAYSEVLGIKKYEELKKNLEGLLSRLRRNGASPEEQTKLEVYRKEADELQKLLEYNGERQTEIDLKLSSLSQKNDELQEKLIREGNSITLEELKELKEQRDRLKEDSISVKSRLKKMLDVAPLIIAGKHLSNLYGQLNFEENLQSHVINAEALQKELNSFTKDVLEKIELLQLNADDYKKLEETFKESLEEKYQSKARSKSVEKKILLDFTEEKYRKFLALYSNLKTSYLEQFNAIVQEEKNIRIVLNSVLRKIKQAEARKDNHLAKKYREAKEENQKEIEYLTEEKNKLILEYGRIQQQNISKQKLLSEHEKNFKIAETDKKKYKVTQELLVKINAIIQRIKEDKKYSLQKSLLLGLQKLMHKDQFIKKVHISIHEDVMDIDLIDDQEHIIDKESLSKGEQQLYATALLKALVDESGIQFPVFIDSPLQKFDKFHAENIIKEFYPSISEQVVLFPLLEKELSEQEYEYVKPNLQQAFLIENNVEGSIIRKVANDQLFAEFKNNTYVPAY